MTGRTHDLAAISTLLVIAVVIPPSKLSLATVICAFLANQIGGIAPDIDAPTAPFWRNLPIGGSIGRIVTKMLGGHRFITHSLIGVGIMGFLTWMFLNAVHPVIPSMDTQIVMIAFMIGIISHLIMDSFTKEGVPWLLPVPVKFGFPPVRSWRVTTGKLFETLLIFPGLVAFDIWYVLTNYDVILEILRQHIV